MSKTQQEIASHLLRIGAVKIRPQNPFTWSSGLKSPIYCDNRLLLSYPNVRSLVRDAFAELARSLPTFDVVGGVATAGIPHGALVADALDAPFIYVRSKAKAHGKQNQIEGHLESGQHVVLIEDLISTGGSSLKAAKAIQDTGAHVDAILAIFSYGFEMAKEASERESIPFSTLISLDDLLDAAKEHGMSAEDRALVVDWRKDPKAWSDLRSNN